MNRRLSACLQPLLPSEVTCLESFEKMISAWADNETLPTAVELISSMARRVQRLPLSDGDSFKEPLGYFDFALKSASQALYILRDTILYFYLPLKDREQAILSIKLAVLVMAFYNPLPALIRSFTIRSDNEDKFNFSERLFDFFKRNDGCTLSLQRNRGCNDRDVSALALLIVCQDVSENIWRLIRSGGDKELIPCIHSFITLNIRDYKEHYSGVIDAVHHAQIQVTQKDLERRLANGPANSASFTTAIAIVIYTLFEEELSEFSGANHQEYVHFFSGEVYVTEKFFSLVLTKLKQLFPTIEWDRINSISSAVQCGIFELDPSGQMFSTPCDKKFDTDTGFTRSLRLINPQSYFAHNSEWFKMYQVHCSTLKKKMAKGRELPIISKQEMAEERATICTEKLRMTDPVGPLTEKAVRENAFWSSLFVKLLREKDLEEHKLRMQKKNMRSSVFWAAAKKNSEESEKRYKEEAAKYTTEIQLEAEKRVSGKLLPKEDPIEGKPEPISAEAAASANCPVSTPEKDKGKAKHANTCSVALSSSVQPTSSKTKTEEANSAEDNRHAPDKSSSCNDLKAGTKEPEFPGILGRLTLSLKYLFSPSQDVVDQIADCFSGLKEKNVPNGSFDGNKSNVAIANVSPSNVQTKDHNPVSSGEKGTSIGEKAAAGTDKPCEFSPQTNAGIPPSDSDAIPSTQVAIEAAVANVSVKEPPAKNTPDEKEELYFDSVPQPFKNSALHEASYEAVNSENLSDGASKESETAGSVLPANGPKETSSLYSEQVDAPAVSNSASDSQTAEGNTSSDDAESTEEYVSEDEEYNEEPDAISDLCVHEDDGKDEFSIELPSVSSDSETEVELEDNLQQSSNAQEFINSDDGDSDEAKSKTKRNSTANGSNAPRGADSQKAVKTSVVKSSNSVAKTKTAGASSKKTAASKAKSSSRSQVASSAKTTKTSIAGTKTTAKTTKAASSAATASPSVKTKGITGNARSKSEANSVKTSAASKIQSKTAVSKPTPATKSTAAKKNTLTKKASAAANSTCVGTKTAVSSKATVPDKSTP